MLSHGNTGEKTMNKEKSSTDREGHLVRKTSGVKGKIIGGRTQKEGWDKGGL